MEQRRKVDYALYKGDKFINLGTLEELAKYLGVKKKTIQFYASNVWKNRSKDRDNPYIAFKIEDDYEETDIL